jgi:hypothetical protein
MTSQTSFQELPNLLKPENVKCKNDQIFINIQDYNNQNRNLKRELQKIQIECMRYG